MSKIIVQIPLTKYLRGITKGWGNVLFVTKTFGGQVWVSSDAPGETFEDEEDKNYIEFNDSDLYIRLPKEVHQYIKLDKGAHKNLKQVLKEIKTKEQKVE